MSLKKKAYTFFIAIFSFLPINVFANQLFLNNVLVSESTLSIQASTESEFDIDRIELKFAGENYELAAEFDDAIGQVYWVAEIDISALPSLEFVALFTITDALQNSFIAEEIILLNRAPKLLIEAPLTQSVARPDIPYSIFT